MGERGGDSSEAGARTGHGGEEDGGGEEDVPLHVEGFVREEVLLDDLHKGISCNFVEATCYYLSVG